MKSRKSVQVELPGYASIPVAGVMCFPEVGRGLTAAAGFSEKGAWGPVESVLGDPAPFSAHFFYRQSSSDFLGPRCPGFRV